MIQWIRSHWLPEADSLVRFGAAAVTLVGVLAFTLSYSGLYLVARDFLGFEPWQAAIFPLIIDLLIVVAYVATFKLTWGQIYAWTVLLLYVGVSIVGNSHSDSPQSVEWHVGRALPPISLAVALHLLERVVRKPQEKKKSTKEPAAPDQAGSGATGAPQPRASARPSNVTTMRPRGERPKSLDTRWRARAPEEALQILDRSDVDDVDVDALLKVARKVKPDLPDQEIRRTVRRWMDYDRRDREAQSSLAMA